MTKRDVWGGDFAIVVNVLLVALTSSDKIITFMNARE